MAKTSDDFIRAVKQKYDVEKTKTYQGFLLEPSSAKLRDLCLLFLDKDLKKKDEEVFECFFQPKEKNELKKAIENFDVEKLKTVCNFLKGTSKKTNTNVLNLIAVLVDYELRPFSKFLHSNDTTTFDELIVKNQKLVAIETDELLIKRQLGKHNFKKKIGVGFISLVGIFTLGYTTNDLVFKNKECMVWQNNHFIEIDCDADSVNNFSDIIPFNDKEFDLERINPDEKTCFFVNGKPKIWYCKVTKDSLDYFTTHGLHPVIGKQLHAITPYIIAKYITKK